MLPFSVLEDRKFSTFCTTCSLSKCLCVSNTLGWLLTMVWSVAYVNMNRHLVRTGVMAVLKSTIRSGSYLGSPSSDLKVMAAGNSRSMLMFSANTKSMTLNVHDG